MPSFDIVSEIDIPEMQNSIENANRELTYRWDFRNITAEFELDKKNETIKVSSESDFQVNQLLDILRDKLAKRGIDGRVLEIPNTLEHNGKTYSILIKLKRGVDKELAKKIIKLIKENSPKVQSQQQGDQVRVIAKSRDDLQYVIAFIKSAELDQPLQFTNFRD